MMYKSGDTVILSEDFIFTCESFEVALPKGLSGEISWVSSFKEKLYSVVFELSDGVVIECEVNHSSFVEPETFKGGDHFVREGGHFSGSIYVLSSFGNKWVLVDLITGAHWSNEFTPTPRTKTLTEEQFYKNVCDSKEFRKVKLDIKEV